MKHTLGILLLMMAIFSASKARASAALPPDSAGPARASYASYYRAGNALQPSVASGSGKVDPALSKKFFFSAVLTPKFTASVPPVSLYFERGIAQFLSLGLDLGVSYDHVKSSDIHVATGLLGARACGYVVPAIAALENKNVNSFGFDPYVGLLYNYYITGVSDLSETGDTFTDSKIGLVVGTRWYPGNKRGFGLLAEYGTTGIAGGGIRFGITLGR